MGRTIRRHLFSPDETAIVHVMNRTTRRCYLFGNDPLSGKNYDHRKGWFEKRLQLLASLFGIDLLCYTIMSNHFHLILRSRPDVVKTWDDTEVAHRWLTLCPVQKDNDGNPLPPTEFALNTIRNDEMTVGQIRRRLSDISWWMRLLCQPIAQRANLEDEATGKFFEARFKATRLLDETALLACAAYVDLNPIRAALAETLEGSAFTSIKKRVDDLKATERNLEKQSVAVSRDSNEATSEFQDAASFLAPIDLHERSRQTGPCVHQDSHRCSDKGFLPMTAAAYAELLDWTARKVRGDKQGATPADLPPLFERLQIDDGTWVRLVGDFGRLFYLMAGKPERIDSHRSPDGNRRFRTSPAARDLLATP
ncbi:MAG: hypothetical protein WCK86_13030 [Planctomycetia bacterium]